MLDEKEKYHFQRQISLTEIGLSGQEKLKSASVLVVGAGGLGCPVLLYLCAAGIGKIGIVDFDTVHESNLHRQLLFNPNDVGNNKALAAKSKLNSQFKSVEINSYPEKLSTKNATQLFSLYDIVVDATDNFSTRYLINDASILCNKPYVFGAIFKFEGQVAVFNHQGSTSYRCLFPEAPRNIPSCEDVGVFGFLCGIIGTKMANEVVKVILGIGEILVGKIEYYNALSAATQVLSYQKNEAEIEKIKSAEFKFESFDYDLFCGIEPPIKESVDTATFNELLKKEAIQIFDIRQDWEEPKLSYNDIIAMPMQSIEEAAAILNPSKKIIVICQNGSRSKIAVDYLKTKYNFKDVANLERGVLEWEKNQPAN